jgi:hypothetical protein
MTTGAIIFAQNNTTIDYVKMAVFAAERIRKYLDIPVSIITDSGDWLAKAYPAHTFDKVIPIPVAKYTQSKPFRDGALAYKMLDWRNQSRHMIYDLTPYDRTIVFDSDYIINSSLLKSAIDNDHDFQIYRKSFSLAPDVPRSEFERLNQYSIPFYWATVFVFNKTPVNSAFFDLVSYVKENYTYFRVLYNIESTTFRNDLAFSIAINIMNGKTEGEFATPLPGSMIYATDKDLLLDIKDDKMKFLVEKAGYIGEYYATKTSGVDVHVMNKFSLTRYIDGVMNV